jgi:hypothetical protein
MSGQSTSITRRRGSGALPRRYTLWEWATGYAAWIAVLPIYLACGPSRRSSSACRRGFFGSYFRPTSPRRRSRLPDVRIPGDMSIPPYMLRWWKIRRNAFFNVYYHIVRRSDDDTALHDHPWWNFSILLEGSYTEH